MLNSCSEPCMAVKAVSQPYVYFSADPFKYLGRRCSNTLHNTERRNTALLQRRCTVTQAADRAARGPALTLWRTSP